MIKVCDKPLVYLLKRIFKASIQEGVFPDCWKKVNVVPINKKQSKNLLKNYMPIGFLPIFGKIYERIIFKELFNHFHQNHLFIKCQSGFLSGENAIIVYWPRNKFVF